MKPYLLTVLFFVGVLRISQAQSPYKLDWTTNGILVGSALVLGGADYLVNKRIEPLTEAEIQVLDVESIPPFDRFASGNNSRSAALRSDWTMYGAIASAVGISAFSTVPRMRESGLSEILTVGTMLVETNLLCYLGTDLTKGLSLRSRPYVYHPDVPMEAKTGIDARKSFFSGHTSAAAANSFFAARVFSDYYPESKWKNLIWGLAIALPAWTAIERVSAGKHFPSDVLAGYAFGAMCGYFVPFFHKNEEGRKGSLTVFPFSQLEYKGLAVTWVF